VLVEISCLDDEKNEKGIPVLNDVKVEFYEKAFRYQVGLGWRLGD
jgi:hypothetical protein